MSGTVSTDAISQYCLIPQTTLQLGVDQSLTIDGPGIGLNFILNGDDHEGFFADSHLKVQHAGVFQSHVQLGAFSDLDLSGIIADAYSYDPSAGVLSLFQHDILADRVLVNAQNGISVASFDPVGNNPGHVLISTGRFSLEEGLRFAIPVHQPATV